MVAANSARLVWDEGWPVGRCGWSAKSAGWGGNGRRTVRVGWRWSANSAGWGGDGGGEQCEVGLERRVARGSVRLVGEECGVGWRWSANSARLVWDEGWSVGRCGWSAKSAGWGGDGGGEQCGLVWDEGWPVSRWGLVACAVTYLTAFDVKHTGLELSSARGSKFSQSQRVYDDQSQRRSTDR